MKTFVPLPPDRTCFQSGDLVKSGHVCVQTREDGSNSEGISAGQTGFMFEI